MKTPITITALSTNAEGIARLDGKVIFTPFTLPGETWNIEIVETKKNYSRGFPLSLAGKETSIPIERIEAPCPYYMQCGGCQLQHTGYPQQLELKGQWLQETFQRVGHLDVDVNPVISASEWEYRNKAVLSVIKNNDRIELAFHAANQPNRFISVQDCMICDPLIREAIPVFQDGLNHINIKTLPYKNPNLPGSKLTLRVMDGKLTYSIDQVRVKHDEKVKLNTYLQEKIQDLDVNRVAAGTFSQVNNKIREKLYDWVCTLPFDQKERLLDGYCGTGELTYQLSKRFRHTDGVEINQQSVASAKPVYGNNTLNFYAQPLESYLTSVQHHYDVIVLNPPRAGLSQPVRDMMVQQKPADIVMISCHPAALARDSAQLKQAGYELSTIQPFDMFPQTYHLETVVHYKKRIKTG